MALGQHLNPRSSGCSGSGAYCRALSTARKSAYQRSQSSPTAYHFGSALSTGATLLGEWVSLHVVGLAFIVRVVKTSVSPERPVKCPALLEKDAPRPGRKLKIGARLRQRVVTMTTRQRPANATHWSTRTIAAAVGISEASVRRIWRAHGLKPHRVETFKISNDPEFAEKLEDIVGLYLNPPEHALVLCADEKSQIQALDRTQPGLPLKRGRGATMTHDYKRNGTATLFAALNAANGEVFGLCKSGIAPRNGSSFSV